MKRSTRRVVVPRRFLPVVLVLGSAACAPRNAATGPKSAAEPPAAGEAAPLASPGPALGSFEGDWHARAFGRSPHTVRATRVALGNERPSCTSKVFVSSSSARYAQGLVQIDELEGPAGEGLSLDPVLCVLHYGGDGGRDGAPLRARPELQASPRVLPSGVIENGVYNLHSESPNGGSAFVFPNDVIVIAYGSAIAPTRALVSTSAASPAPLPVSAGVYRWSGSREGARWRLSWDSLDGRERRIHHYEDETNARGAELANGAAVPALLAKYLANDLRVWRQGTDVYFLGSPKRREWMR